MCVSVAFVCNASAIASREKNSAPAARTSKRSCLSALHADFVACEVDMGERGVYLQCIGNRLARTRTIKNPSLPQHRPLNGRAFASSSSISLNAKSMLVSAEFVFNMFASALRGEKALVQQPPRSEPPGLKTRSTNQVGRKVHVGQRRVCLQRFGNRLCRKQKLRSGSL